MDTAQISFGLDTFGDVPGGPDGTPVSHAAAIRQVLDEAVLAEASGVDAFSVGEHHRADYAISSPETVLAGIATRTERIRLGSAVTVLSSDDPVRVFERFATVDALSRGRVDVVLGRGSFIESFPLFGYNLDDYHELFEEKLELFVELLDEKPVTWSGKLRPPLADADVFPKTEGGRMATWVGVGGSPESVVRTARHGLGMMLAIIGGAPDRFAAFADLFRQSAEKLGHGTLPLGVHSPGFIADTDADAKEAFFEHFKAQRDRIGAERGWPPMSLDSFHHEVTHGSLYLGSPATVAPRIARTIRLMGADRFDMVYTSGTVAADARLRSVELYGTEVAPRVRELLAAVD